MLQIFQHDQRSKHASTLSHRMRWKGCLEVSSPVSWWSWAPCTARASCYEPFPIKIWTSASMEIPESFWVTCFRAHPRTLGNIFMCNQRDPALLHALSAGSEDSQALGNTLSLLILLPSWWDTPCLGLHTTAIFQSHFLGLHSHLCQPALSYQYNLAAKYQSSGTFRVKKKEKKQVNYQFPPITQITQLCHIFSLQTLSSPDIPPFMLTPHSQEDGKLSVRRVVCP